MRAKQVLQKCLSFSLEAIHALREKSLMQAVDALLTGRRLTLMDMARAWPGAERVPLDRLLSNPHLHVERESLYTNVARWLLRGPHPVIVVDWSAFKSHMAMLGFAFASAQPTGVLGAKAVLITHVPFSICTKKHVPLLCT